MDFGAENEALNAYMEQSRNLMKAPDHLRDLTESREQFNTALLTGTGTVGGVLATKGIAGIKKKALDPLFTKGSKLAKQATDKVGKSLDELSGRVQDIASQLKDAVDTKFGQVKDVVAGAQQQANEAADGFSEAAGTLKENPYENWQKNMLERVKALPAERRAAVNDVLRPELDKFNQVEAKVNSGELPKEALDFERNNLANKAEEVLKGAEDIGDGAGEAPASAAMSESTAARPGTATISRIAKPTYAPEVPEAIKPPSMEDMLDEDPFSGVKSLGQTVSKSDALGDGVSDGLVSTGEDAGTVAAGENAGKDVAEGLGEAAVTDAELGGPADLFGDIISIGVGLGTIFAGLSGTKKAPEPTYYRPSNPNTQKGLGGY